MAAVLAESLPCEIGEAGQNRADPYRLAVLSGLRAARDCDLAVSDRHQRLFPRPAYRLAPAPIGPRRPIAGTG